MLQQHAARAQRIDRRHLMAHQNDRPPMPRNVPDLPQALLLERDVSHRQHFVNQQNFWLQMRRHSKRQPHVHP